MRGEPCTPLPKPTPKLLDKRERARALAKRDKEERAKCRARSGGICETRCVNWPHQCFARATENHHLIGGSGRRNRRRSILADHRLDVCKDCHREITGHVLVPCVEQALAECAATVRYERRT
jgi:hypothetical protein